MFISNTSRQTWVTEKMIMKKNKTKKAAWNLLCRKIIFKNVRNPGQGQNQIQTVQ